MTAAADGGREPGSGGDRENGGEAADGGATGRLSAWIVGPGRMGRDIGREWADRGHRVTATIGPGDAWPEGGTGADVAFEFTEPGAAAENVSRLLERGVPTVCGTTGWEAGPARQQAAAGGVPLLVASNFSVGIAALRSALDAASERFGGVEGWDAAVFERHHRAKKDAPSGTARALADRLAALLGERPEVASLRQGDQPGEHRVIVEGPEEELVLAHRARSRRPFVVGAVEAAEWIVRESPPGPVTFDEVLEARRDEHG